MAIQDLQLTSDQFARIEQFRTSDGKLIKVKNFCVEEDCKPVFIGEAGVGSRLRLRNGEVIEIIGTSKTSGGNKKSEKYWHFGDGRAVNLKREFDVVEILEFKEYKPVVPLTDLQWGDSVRTRSGQLFRYEGERAGEQLFCKRIPGSENGLYFLKDGRCNLYTTEDEVVEIIRALRVRLDQVKVGDSFRIRTGEILTCSRLDTMGSPIYAARPESYGLYYSFDGKCASDVSGGHDAVEWIKRDILGDIGTQLKGVDSSHVDRIVVSSQDWPEILEQYRSRFGDSCYVFVDQVRVFHDSSVKSGQFYLLFKAK